MRRAWLWLAVLGSGCTSIDHLATREDLKTAKDQLAAADERKAAELRQELTGVKGDFVTVQKIEQNVTKQLDEMRKLHDQLVALGDALSKKVDLANTNVLKVLEFEEQLLSDRLARLRLMIKELQDKK